MSALGAAAPLMDGVSPAQGSWGILRPPCREFGHGEEGELARTPPVRQTGSGEPQPRGTAPRCAFSPPRSQEGTPRVGEPGHPQRGDGVGGPQQLEEESCGMGLCLPSGPAPIPSLTLTPSLSLELLHASGFHLLLCCWGGPVLAGPVPLPQARGQVPPARAMSPPQPHPAPLLPSCHSPRTSPAVGAPRAASPCPVLLPHPLCVSVPFPGPVVNKPPNKPDFAHSVGSIHPARQTSGGSRLPRAVAGASGGGDFVQFAQRSDEQNGRLSCTGAQPTPSPSGTPGRSHALVLFVTTAAGSWGGGGMSPGCPRPAASPWRAFQPRMGACRLGVLVAGLPPAPSPAAGLRVAPCSRAGSSWPLQGGCLQVPRGLGSLGGATKSPAQRPRAGTVPAVPVSPCSLSLHSPESPPWALCGSISTALDPVPLTGGVPWHPCPCCP